MSKTPTPKPVTEFCERCDAPAPWGRGSWLGISRIPHIPDAGWPSRESCQKAVSAEERAAGLKLVEDYRAMEKQAMDHDADARQRDMDRLACGGTHGFERTRLRKELEACDREKFLGAQSRLNELRVDAERLAQPIFERLIVEFDKELHAVALRREEELIQMGVSLYVDRNNDHGDIIRHYTTYADPIVTAWQCRRECVRHSALNIGKDNAVASVQYLCTDEEHTPFAWLQ